jgi:hypothetical protein
MTSTSSVNSDIDYIDQYLGVDEDYSNIENIGLSCEDDTNKDNNNLINDISIFSPPPVYISNEVKEICSVNSLPYYFKSQEEAKFMLRESQCKIGRRFNIPYNDPKRYVIRCCSFPKNCNFNIKIRTTKAYGNIITGGNGVHTCDLNQHIIEHCTSRTPASSTEFLVEFIKLKVREGTVSPSILRLYLLKELNFSVFYVNRFTCMKRIIH